MSHYIDGLATFSWTLVLFLAAGYVIAIGFAVTRVKAERKQKAADAAAQNAKNILSRVASLLLVHEPVYNIFYLYNQDTGVFVLQDTNPIHLMETVRNSFIAWDVVPADEETAVAFVQAAQKLSEAA